VHCFIHYSNHSLTQISFALTLFSPLNCSGNNTYYPF
jgi:hypothetical protein